MLNDTPSEIKQSVEAVLTEWRNKALRVLLVVFSFLGLVALVIQITTDTRHNADYLGVSIFFAISYLIFLFVAFYRKSRPQTRGWALLMILYIIGVLSLARGGLAGDGRLILFVLPFLAALLVSLEATYFMVFLDAATMLAFIFFAHTGLMQEWVLDDIITSPFSLSIWIPESLYTSILMGISLPLMVLFVNFLVRTVENEVRSNREVSEARVQLQQVNQNLEEKVKQRTTELERAMQEAQEARKAAEEGNRAKSSFLATISHEIRTPLNAAIGMTSLLQDSPLTMEQTEYTNTIRKSSETLLSLINDILDFSKIEAGRMELDLHPFSIQHCLDTVLDLTSPKAIEKSITLAWEIEPGVPVSIIGDETRLRQVLINLVSNAVKFTKKGEVAISISAGLQSQTEDENKEKTLLRLAFAIRDTGIGIPANRISQLFLPFRQVDDSPSRRYGGTGLGLVICKRLVEMMGGEIWVESEEGKGSTFFFTILVEPATTAQKQPHNDARLDLGDKRILIIDDNPSNRRILNLQIQAWNMAPRATGSANEAILWLRQGETFDAIIINWQTGEYNKLSLIHEIRKVRTAHEMPVVVLMEDLQEAPANMAFTTFLAKSNKASHLYNALIGIFANDVELALRQDTQRIPLFDPNMSTRLPLRILMVEDNNINQNLITLMLERMGYRPDLAGNGIEALQALHRQDYDVVLMDVQMPEMDGLEATRRIRKDFPLERQPRIIAMTAHAMTGDRELCLESGMDDYISKPIHIEDLVASLKHCEQRFHNRPERLIVQEESSPLAAGLSPNLALEINSISRIDQTELDHLKGTLGARAAVMMPPLVNSFFKQAEKLIDDLDNQIRSGEVTEVLRLAHTLKSNCSSFGASRLANMALRLERLARQQTLNGARPILEQIKVEYPEVKTALAAVLQNILQ